MSQLTIQLPVELNEFVQSSIVSGAYAGANDLVTQALYAFRDHVELDRMKLQRLRRDIQTGLDQLERGEVVTDFDVESFLAEKKRSRNQPALTA